MAEESGDRVAERIADRLARYLGPHTGRVAVKTFAARALGRGPETLVLDDVPAMTQALRPMLRTLLGKQRCEVVLQQILREFGL
ncbi:MAG TPA: hypothetical protein VGG39_09920 [Polyangiaceae bacterium]|jgi:hypothetical protein